MRQSSRVIASILGLTLTLTACGGQNSSLPSMPSSNNGGPMDSSVRSATPGKPLISIPKLYGDLAYTDAGRRAATAPVRVSLTLRYNHQAELDRFVAKYQRSALESASSVLNGETVQRSLRANRGAGKASRSRIGTRRLHDRRTSIQIERSWMRRLALRPSSDFFATEIHTVHQGKHGERYTNVTSATVPSSIAKLVRDVSLNNLVVVRTVTDQSGVEGQRSAPQFQTDGQGRPIIPLGGIHSRRTLPASSSTETLPAVRSAPAG